MSSPSQASALSQTDRYESTFVVSLDPTRGDFTSLQDALNATAPIRGQSLRESGRISHHGHHSNNAEQCSDPR
jgi:hypothetical protein